MECVECVERGGGGGAVAEALGLASENIDEHEEEDTGRKEQVEKDSFGEKANAAESSRRSGNNNRRHNNHSHTFFGRDCHSCISAI